MAYYKKNMNMLINNLLLRASLAPLAWQQPMLATLTYEYFSHHKWIFECKFDGERCLAYRDADGIITLYSRNQQILNDVYPELVHALEISCDKSFIIDGEIIALDKKGISSFMKLQKRIGLNNATAIDIAEVPVYFYVFDIQYFDNHDLRKLSLLERKEILKAVIKFNDKVLWTDYIKEKGIELYNEAKQKGWEGIIAKKADSIYQNKRSRDWLKFKCSNGQELIIIGYTEPQGSRIGFGALLLGYYKGNKLCYAGKVGTGFNRMTLINLKQKFMLLEIPELELEKKYKGKGVHWLKPQLVCEVRFSEWTNNSKLRHPRYLGIRVDKEAKNIVKEGLLE